jgi:hypothetical protein
MDEITVSSTYSYEAKQPKKLHFYIKFSLLYNDNKEIVLPVQKSTNPIVMQQRLYNRRGYTSFFEYVHTFSWTNLGSAIESLSTRKSYKNDSQNYQHDNDDDEIFIASEERLILKNKEIEDVTLKFGIIAYFPTDPVYTGSENCHHHLLQESLSSSSSSQITEGLVRDSWKNSLPIIPPYLKHANSMLHDDKYSDVILRVGDLVFSAHRIILAS